MKTVARLMSIAAMLFVGLTFSAYRVALAAPGLRVGTVIHNLFVAQGTETSTITDTPESSSTPEVTDTPEVTETQETEMTDTAEATETPHVTETPEPTETDDTEESSTPEATQSPDVQVNDDQQGDQQSTGSLQSGSGDTQDGSRGSFQGGGDSINLWSLSNWRF
jgi:outer membrane biosynthesis protein TonB